jgi:hypothetical protein
MHASYRLPATPKVTHGTRKVTFSRREMTPEGGKVTR